MTEEIKAEISVSADGEIGIINSPLEEVNPSALDELFTRIDSTLKLGKIPDREDIDKVVLLYRRQRQKFVQEEAIKVPKARQKSIGGAAAKKITSVKQALTLDDI